AMDRGPDRDGVVIGVSACRSASLSAGGNAVDERLQGGGPLVADGELLVLVALATEKKRVPMRKVCAISGIGEAGGLQTFDRVSNVVLGLADTFDEILVA